MRIQEVYVVMAVEGNEPEGTLHELLVPEKEVCYCVCDSRKVAVEVIEKDTKAGDIQPGATIHLHALQTKEMV